MSGNPERDLRRIEKKMRFLDELAANPTGNIATLCRQAKITPKILNQWQQRDAYFALNVHNYLTRSRDEADDERYSLLVSRSHMGDLDAMMEFLMWQDNNSGYI